MAREPQCEERQERRCAVNPAIREALAAFERLTPDQQELAIDYMRELRRSVKLAPSSNVSQRSRPRIDRSGLRLILGGVR